MQREIEKQVPFNFVVNVIDGGFFGMALGFASFTTVIPLFINTLTDSSLLIGVITSLHLVGWQLPQILTSSRVAKLLRYKKMVIPMTFQERWPFLLLAVVALLTPRMSRELALLLTFILIGWQSFGGGFTATAWQSMIAKIIPSNRRGTFYGSQSALANLLGAGGAAVAGFILLGTGNGPEGYAICFLIAGVLMMVSFWFICQTREPNSPAVGESALNGASLRQGIAKILREDKNYRMFILARALIQTISGIATAFYTVYAVERFGIDPATVGFLTGVYLLAATISNPLFGWLGDRWNRRLMFVFGSVLVTASAGLALLATDGSWFFLIYVLFGLSNGAAWTSANAMLIDFGTEQQRPYYIGLANTLVAPATLLAPMVGGALADFFSWDATFAFALATGVVTIVVAYFFLRDPKVHVHTVVPEPHETPAATGVVT